jgi:hypothetical protein
MACEYFTGATCRRGPGLSSGSAGVCAQALAVAAIHRTAVKPTLNSQPENHLLGIGTPHGGLRIFPRLFTITVVCTFFGGFQLGRFPLTKSIVSSELIN